MFRICSGFKVHERNQYLTYLCLLLILVQQKVSKFTLRGFRNVYYYGKHQTPVAPLSLYLTKLKYTTQYVVSHQMTGCLFQKQASEDVPKLEWKNLSILYRNLTDRFGMNCSPRHPHRSRNALSDALKEEAKSLLMPILLEWDVKQGQECDGQVSMDI